MIHKEAWYVEAGSLEAELARLKKLLFQDAISELEFANAVIRLHGTMGYLEKQADGTFRVTTEWRQAHREEVEKIEALANEILVILQAQGLDLETFAQEVGAFGANYLEVRDWEELGLMVVPDSEEGEVEATPLQQHLYSTWGWTDSPTYELAREYMHDISTKWFHMGAPALVIPGEVGFPFAETVSQSVHELFNMRRPAQSEAEFNEYLPHLGRALEAALVHIRQGI